MHDRTKKHDLISQKLAGLSDSQLCDLFKQEQPVHSGIGGESVLMTLDGTRIFVKKVPLTDLERVPQHVMSSKNLFDLPVCYQYGIGSAGFGVWRELRTHIKTTEWVLSGACTSFPILYHWRVLRADKPKPMSSEASERLERDVSYWENSPAIRARLQANYDASAHVFLFLEYVPETLGVWLEGQIKKGGEAADLAVVFAEKKLKETAAFMNAQGFQHFDAHFKNILTEGKELYFTDFGLASSFEFELTDSETEFLKTHQIYDPCCIAVNLLHCIISSLFGEGEWTDHLKAYLRGEKEGVSLAISEIIRKYVPVALIMDDFYGKLQKQSKLTPFPCTELEGLLKDL